MLIRSTARVSALLSMLLSASVSAFAGDAIGVLHPMCGFPYQYILEITNYRGHRLEEPIKFKVLGDYLLQLEAGQWVEAAYAIPEGDIGRMYEILLVSVSVKSVKYLLNRPSRSGFLTSPVLPITTIRDISSRCTAC